jgi:predicted amidohydrolase YtcJ
MPGIVDAHNHVRLGCNPDAVSLAGAASLAEIRSRIGAHLRAHPGIDWIEGEGWNYAGGARRKADGASTVVLARALPGGGW